MAGFAQGSVELKHKTSGTNANIDHLRIYAKDDEYLFTVDNDGNERSLQYYHSTGVSDSILHDLVDNGNGTANISGCNVRLYKTTDFSGDIYEYYVSGTTLSFIDGLEQYVVADYNNGNPILRVESNKNNVNESNVSCLFCCWRQGNEIHSVGTDSKALGLSNKISRSITDTIPYRKSVDGGLIISETNIPTPRTILITSAVVYSGVIPNNILSFNSWVDRMTLAYHSGGNWLYVDEDLYNNTQYDDGANLQTIPNNKFAVRWYYRSIGDIKQTFYVLGKNYYNSITDARNEYVRNDLPIVIRKHCVLVGRSIIEYNALNGITEYVQDISFASTTIPNHNDLNNIQGGSLGNYYHISASTFGYLSAVSADIQSQLNSKLSSAASPSLHNNLLGLQGGSSGNYYHVSASTFGYLSAVSADIQSQLNSKISSAAAPSNHNDLDGLQGGDIGNYYHVSATTFGYLSGVSADIQEQINSKADISAVPTITDIGNYLPLSGGAMTGHLSARNIIPEASFVYSLGTSSSRWVDFYCRVLTADSLTTTIDTVTSRMKLILGDGDNFGTNGQLQFRERSTFYAPNAVSGDFYSDGNNLHFYDKSKTKRTLAYTSDLASSISGYLPLSGGTVLSGVNFNQNIYVSQNISANSFKKHGGLSTQFLKADGSIDSNSYALKSSLGNYLPISGGTLTGQLKVSTISASGNISASSFIKNGGTSTQFLKADGSIDSNSYALNSSLSNYLPLSGGVLTGSLDVKSFVSASGEFRSSNSTPLRFSNIGDGTYNIGVLYHSSAGTIFERARVSDSIVAQPVKFGIGTRGTSENVFEVSDKISTTLSISAIGNISASNSYLNSLTLNSADISAYNTGNVSPIKRIYQNMGNNDYWSIYGEGADNNGSMVLEVGDDLSEYIKFRFKNTYSPYTTYTPYEFAYNTFTNTGARVRIYYDDLIDSNSDYAQNCLEVATNTSNISHSYKPGIGFHSQGQYASLLYLNSIQDWKAKDSNGGIVTFYHTGNLPSVLGNYLPLSGGTMTGDISFTNLTTGIGKGLYGTNGDNDHWRIVGGSNGLNQCYLEIATNDDKSEPIYIKQYQGTFSSPVSTRTLTLLDSNGNTLIPQTLSSTNYYNAGSYYVSNYAAGGSPALITNQGLATFYTLNLDYYSTGERSLKFADCVYLGPTYATDFNNGSTQNNALVVKGAGNYDYAGIYFGTAGINSRYIGTKGDNTLYINGPSIKTIGSLTQTGTSTFVGNTNIGRVAWINEYTNTVYDKFNVSGTTTISDLISNGSSTFNGVITTHGVSYFNNNLIQNEGSVYLGSINNDYALRVKHASYFTGTTTFSTNSVTFNSTSEFNSSANFSALTKFNVGSVIEPVFVNSTSYTATDTSPGFLAFSNLSTTATKIILSDSIRDGKCILIFNWSSDTVNGRTLESSVAGGIQTSPSTTVTSTSIPNGYLYICIKFAAGAYAGGWRVRAL